MTLPDVGGLKRPLFAVAFFTLVIYMANRAIAAIVYPYESEILQNQQQQEAGSLFFIELDFSTAFISNSVVFPVLLVIFYRLAALSAKKPLMIVLALHYLSVICVSVVAWSAAQDEFEEQSAMVTQYEDATGRIVTRAWQMQQGARAFGEPVQVREDENGQPYYEHEEDGVPVYLTELKEPVLPFSTKVEFFYSPVASLLLALMSLLVLPVFYRFDYSAAYPDTVVDADPQDGKA